MVNTTILTCVSIDNTINYVLTGLFDIVDAARIIRKQKYEPIKEPLNDYCSRYAKENNTRLIVQTIECKTV